MCHNMNDDSLPFVSQLFKPTRGKVKSTFDGFLASILRAKVCVC